jgi:hypothetical protein
MPQVRNDNGAAHQKGHAQGLFNLLSTEPGLDRLLQVIIDAIVAAKYGRGHKPQKLLGSAVKGAVPVRLLVEREHSLDGQIVGFQNGGVALFTFFPEDFEGVRHEPDSI